MRSARLITLLVLLFASVSVHAQQITITGQVKDPNGVPYTNGRGRVLLTPTNVFYTTGLTNPVPGSQSPVIIDGLDANGRFSVVLTSTAALDQQSSTPQWLFTFCSAPILQFGPICFSGPVLALTSSQDITAQISAVPPPILPGGGTGGAPPAPPSGALQKAASPSPVQFSASSVSEPPTGPLTGTLSIAEDVVPKGPNPYVDARQYGVRAIIGNVTPAVSGITATTTGGNTQVTISTSTCAGQANSVCFLNGDGVTIYGVGAAITMSTPGAPTITPSNAQAGTGTGSVVNAPTGATTFNYKVLACDIGGGCTAASSTGTTTTGNALGAQSLAVTSITRANDTLTFNTPSQPNLSIGTVVHVDGCGNTDNVAGFCGWFRVATVTGTGFTSTSTGLDTRNGALTTSVGGATANWWNCNHVTWSAVAGAFRYVIQSDRQNPGTFVNVGMSWVVNPINSSFTDGTLFFDDFGQTMMARSAASIPGYVPTNGLTTNDNLTTTISSGAGTTTLILAVAPSASLAGQTIVFDNAPNIVSMNSAVSGPIEFPFAPVFASYVTNSVMSLTARSNPLLFPSAATFRDTVILGQQASWYGDRLPGASSGTSFQPKSLPQIAFATTPGILVASGSTGEIRGLEFDGAPNGIAVQQDGGGGDLGFNYDYVNFVGAGTSTDYMSMGFLCRGVFNGACVSRMGTVLFSAGTQAQVDASFTPSGYWDDSGDCTIDNLMGNSRPLLLKADASSGGLRIGSYHWQGNTAPIVTVSNLLGTNQVLMGDAGLSIIDTGPHAAVFNAATGSQNVVVTCGYNLFGCGAPSTNLPSFTGSRVTIGTGPFNTGQNRDAGGFTYGLVQDGVLNVNIAGNYSSFRTQTAISASPTYPIFIESATPAAPVVVVQAGGTLSIGTHTIRFIPVWQNNGEGVASQQANCVTSTGNQTCAISWTAVPGNPKGYDLVIDGNPPSGVGLPCSAPQTTLTSFTLSANPGACWTLNVLPVPSGGPTMLMPGVQGIATPQLTVQNIFPFGTNGAAPICSVTGAGTGATCGTFQTNADDMSGAFTISTGTTPAATGTFTLSFNNSTGGFKYCVFIPANTGLSNWNARASFIITAAGGSNNQATWDNNAVNLAASSTYVVQYVCGRH